MLIKKHKTMPHELSALIHRLKGYFKSRKDVLFSYLFGSFAYGRTTPLSDVDVAVYVDGEDFAEKRLEILGNLVEILKTDDVDLVILNRAPLPLRMRVLQKKVLLVDNDPFARHDFESATIRSYLDFSKIEKFILKRRYLHG